MHMVFLKPRLFWTLNTVSLIFRFDSSVGFGSQCSSSKGHKRLEAPLPNEGAEWNFWWQEVTSDQTLSSLPSTETWNNARPSQCPDFFSLDVPHSLECILSFAFQSLILLLLLGMLLKFLFRASISHPRNAKSHYLDFSHNVCKSFCEFKMFYGQAIKRDTSKPANIWP